MLLDQMPMCGAGRVWTNWTRNGILNSASWRTRWLRRYFLHSSIPVRKTSVRPFLLKRQVPLRSVCQILPWTDEPFADILLAQTYNQLRNASPPYVAPAMRGRCHSAAREAFLRCNSCVYHVPCLRPPGLVLRDVSHLCSHSAYVNAPPASAVS